MIHQDQPNGATATATNTNTTAGTTATNGTTFTSPSSSSYSSSTSHRPVPFIPKSFTNNDSDASARDLILALRPDWSSPDSSIEFVRFTDGITNTLLKAVNKRPGLSRDDVDREAILLRAYGNGTDLIIDRARETQNHELLMQHGLAPELLARFENGMMYRFIRGAVTHPEGLRRRHIYLAVARRLAQWHATVPCLPGKTHLSERLLLLGDGRAADGPTSLAALQEAVDGACPGKQAPNIWTVMQKWIFALPTETQAQRERQALLQRELTRLVAELSPRPGLGSDGLVFAHCDLLCGNVIVLPKGEASSLPDIPAPATTTTTRNNINNDDDDDDDEPTAVTFIDYEYAVPSPAAFDLANHFAEWGGFDCDFSVLPTRSQRREFAAEYVRAYFALRPGGPQHPPAYDHEAEVRRLTSEVDAYRGVPGFYWGIWSLIQATISQIDFDYASYAEVRLGEYWAWRAEVDGSRLARGESMPLREKRWAEE